MASSQEEFVRFEDVAGVTDEEYFNGNQFSINAFRKKYQKYEGETYVQALKRTCDYIASAEPRKEDRDYWSERWFHEIYNDWWHPAGSIVRGADSGRKISLANCTTISLGNTKEDEEWDNLESIIKNASYKVAKTAAYRQGLGVDFSRLRPNGTAILNSSNESSGAIHWMKFIDSIGYYVGQKGRIPAMLFSISCDHPDVADFIEVKKDYTQIQNANISVQCTDEFYDAVRRDAVWKMEFDIPEVNPGDKVYVHPDSADSDCVKERGTGRYYKIAKHHRPAENIFRLEKARKLLELIANNMWSNAEPGIQNIDVARKYSNSDYVYDADDEYDSRICSTNACSEQYLSPNSLCVLASINAGRFSVVVDVFKREIARIGHSINRFLDNVNQKELDDHTYATPEQRLAIEKLRRTGAGVTNIGAYLFKRGVEYGSEKGNEITEEFMRQYNYYLYESSIELGREKGSFGLFDRKKLEHSPFIQRMIQEGLKFDALRNVTNSSIAPTGTLSLMFRDTVMSYGIEPPFGMYFWKRTRMTGEYCYYFCVPHVVREVFEQAGYPIPMDSDTIEDTWDGKHGRPIVDFIEEHKDKVGVAFRRSTDVTCHDKLEMMSGVMKWVDSSISVTYHLPEDSSWEDVYEFILEANRKEVKSIAAFPDKKMYGIVSFLPFKDLALDLISEGVDIHPQNFSSEELEQLSEETEDKKSVHSTTSTIVKNDAPKRNKKMPAELHYTRVQGSHYHVVVGLLNGEPYEVFVHHNDSGKSRHGIFPGHVTKLKRGRYIGEFDDLTIENVSGNCTEGEEALCRMVSTSLRHGADVNFVVHQLEKTKGDLQSPSKAIGRILKKYIRDGQKVTGEECPECKNNTLIRAEGCIMCPACEWTKCS